MKRTNETAKWFAGVVLVAAMTSPILSAQTRVPVATQIASAVLPLPEPLRAAATVVANEGSGKYTVLKKGSNEMVCMRQPNTGSGRAYQGGETFWAECYNESIFALMKRSSELTQEFRASEKTVTNKMVDDALDNEIKAGKLKLPSHPTTGFQMRGPLTGYHQATNSVSSEIAAWQMVIIPYATGASLSLPETRTEGLPWVMDSGSWMAHVMVTHAAPANMDH